MAWLSPRIGLFALAVVAAVGCSPIRPQGKSPLAPARMSPDSVALDIFFVRFPFGKEEINGPLWDEIDEQHFPPEVRRRLLENGFRVGVVAGQLPMGLSQLLELKDKPAPDGRPQETNLADLEAEPRVVRRYLQLRANQRSEIIASEIYEQLPVLTCESGDVCGQTYPKAQGVLIVKTRPERDGRVRLELVPELQYGDVKQRYAGNHGAVRLETGRSRRDFDNLALAANLAPGDTLVLGSLPNRTGSLGHHFFTHESTGKLEQKLLVIRLGQTQHDELFNQQPPALDAKVDVEERGPKRPDAAAAKK